MCKKGKVSYGYPMGMVWVSYGKTSQRPNVVCLWVPRLEVVQ